MPEGARESLPCPLRCLLQAIVILLVRIYSYASNVDFPTIATEPLGPVELGQESACDGVPVMVQKVSHLAVDPQVGIGRSDLGERSGHEADFWSECRWVGSHECGLKAGIAWRPLTPRGWDGRR